MVGAIADARLHAEDVGAADGRPRGVPAHALHVKPVPYRCGSCHSGLQAGATAPNRRGPARATAPGRPTFRSASRWKPADLLNLCRTLTGARPPPAGGLHAESHSSSVFLLASVTAFRQPRTWWPGSTYDPAIPTPRPCSATRWRRLHRARGDARLHAAPRGSSNGSRSFSVGRRTSVARSSSSLSALPRTWRDSRKSARPLRSPGFLPRSAKRRRATSQRPPGIAWMNFANDGTRRGFEAGHPAGLPSRAGTDAATAGHPQGRRHGDHPAHNPDSHSRQRTGMKASATASRSLGAGAPGDWRMDTTTTTTRIDSTASGLPQPGRESTIVRELHRWNPVVFVDHHGNPDRFFFPPWALPVNAQIDARSRQWVET